MNLKQAAHPERSLTRGQSHDLEIMTWAKSKSQMFHQLSHRGTPKIYSFKPRKSCTCLETESSFLLFAVFLSSDHTSLHLCPDSIRCFRNGSQHVAEEGCYFSILNRISTTKPCMKIDFSYYYILTLGHNAFFCFVLFSFFIKNPAPFANFC